MSTADDILRRVPPQNLEAEESVLGAVVIAPRYDADVVDVQRRILAEVTAIVGASDFYASRIARFFA